MLKKAYYRLRPFMTAGMRARVQRFCARDWNDLQFPKWPVDTTVENICERLLLMSMEARGIDEMPFVWFWPKGAQGCVCMTHDVETKAGRDFCPTLMDIDDSFGIKSSFQLVPESRYAVTQELVESFRSRGFEVAIHGLSHDGTLFDDREEFLRDAAKINRYAREYGAKGFRADVLYRNPEWYDAFDFSFDMSIPNVGHLDPQRGGCCTVMPYFIGDILEIPVTAVQDYMLFHLLKQRSIDLWKAQVATILEKQGCVSFIVHPDYVMDPEHMAIYQDLLRHLQELRAQTNTWFALPHQIDNWWRSRSQMRVERVQGSWRIVGEGAEQAALAFARKVDGKLIYDVMEVAVAP